nr:BAG family molecular chaperone regulator 4-like [Tanacetum cinerariifolium]
MPREALRAEVQAAKTESGEQHGDLKNILARETSLKAPDQRLLFKRKGKGDDERLDIAGVKDMSKVIFMEDPASKERKLFDKSESRDNVKAYVAVLNARTEHHIDGMRSITVSHGGLPKLNLWFVHLIGAVENSH